MHKYEHEFCVYAYIYVSTQTQEKGQCCFVKTQSACLFTEKGEGINMFG